MATAAAIPALLLPLLLVLFPPRGDAFFSRLGVVALLVNEFSPPVASANAAGVMPPRAAIVTELVARAATACTWIRSKRKQNGGR